MWTQIENSWAAMTGRMRSNVPELANLRSNPSVVITSLEEVLEELQIAEPDTPLVPAPPLD